MPRFTSALASLLFLGALLAPAPAHAVAMVDSTIAESWRLPNGLEVRVRHIPGAVGASVSLAYRAGALHMPDGHGQLAALLAELQFTAAAGDVPERSRAELALLRPDGWDVRTNDHVAVLTEVANRQQLPGVLLQVAARAHGVQPSDSCFRQALLTLRTSLGRERLGEPDLVLHHRVRDIALGYDDNRVFALAQAKDLAGATRASTTQLLGKLYVPSNATLAIAGDFGGLDLHTLITKLFADIPAGSPEPDRLSPALRPATRASLLAGIDKPVGVIGVLSPALEDTLHPSFYLGALLAGAGWHDHVGNPRPPLASVFHYSVLDEPDMARFYVQPSADLTDTTTLVTRWADVIDLLRGEQFLTGVLDQARMSVDWMLGGPISLPMRRLMRRDISPLPELTASMATRATWKGDAFWDVWRHRFETTRLSPLVFFDYMLADGHRAVVLVTPRH